MLPIYLRHALNQNKKRRIRYRYIGFRIFASNRRFSWKTVAREIELTANRLYLEDSQKLQLSLIKFNGREGILRCSHLYKDDVIRLLRSITKIGNKDVKLVTVGTSGTIRSLNRKFFRNVIWKKKSKNFDKNINSN